MDEREIRLRCIEAAAKFAVPHAEGYAAGVQASAATWLAWILAAKAPLGLPKK